MVRWARLHRLPIVVWLAHKNPPLLANIHIAANALNVARLIRLSPTALDGMTQNFDGSGGSLSFSLGFLGRLNPDISSQDTGFP